MLPALARLASNSASLRILDIGCGSGSLTVDLAIALPTSSVTGIDICGAVLESAKVFALHRDVRNVHFQQADAHHLPFTSNSFDAVLVHQTLAQFFDRKQAISEILRVTRKGGIVCLREGDLTTARFWPEDEVLNECFDVIREVHELEGGAMDAGMRLRTWLREAGVAGRKMKGSCSAVWYHTAEERRAYGGHWPGRCGNGVFHDRAVELGVTR
jgi:SAM-dependent methyltransferase